MFDMRVRGKVVGNVVVLEEALPEGVEVEVVTTDEAGVYVDDTTAQELALAMKEADTEEGVSVEEAFARLPPRQRIA
jgi:DNA-directed RNA polymerase specialized sigma24 family protein